MQCSGDVYRLQLKSKLSLSRRAARLVAAAAAMPLAAAQRPSISERPALFVNDSVQLSATLITPQASGRHPAVVFLYGSGPATRAAGCRPD